MARQTTESELTSYFQEWVDTSFQNGLLDPDNRDLAIQQFLSQRTKLIAGINSRGKGQLKLNQRQLTIIIREGSDPDHGPFSLFEMRWSGKQNLKRLRCFLGHRFLPELSQSLRSDLQYILAPSRIDLIIAGRDLTAVGFFDDIVSKIRTCDFCIFDNRQASEKPNVYIEAGIAYALGKPFILANYLPNRLEMPSDLTHINNIPYSGYSELMRKVYFQLPIFLRDNGLRRR